MKKILLVSGFIADTYSEIEKSLVELSVFINKSKEKEIIWLVPNIKNKYNRYKNKELYNSLVEPIYVSKLKENSIKVIELNLSKYNLIKNFFELRKVIRKQEIDEIYTHFNFERFYGAFIGKILGVRVVWNEHWLSLNTKFRRLKKVFYKIFIDDFICISRAIYDSIPYDNKHLVYNGINVDEYKKITLEDRNDLCKKLNLKSGMINIIMVGAFRKEKRHDIAAEIINKVCKKNKEIQFILLGDGEYKEKFINKINEFEIENNVKVVGHVNNVNEYYKIVDLAFLTCLTEGFGYTIIEAMSQKIPFIAFDSAGPTEIIEDNINGYLISKANIDEFVDKIISVLKDYASLEKIGENARTRVISKFSRINWMKEINKIL